MPLPSSPAGTPPASRVPGPFRVLTVCTGNICRSPLAEALLRDGLSSLGKDVVVASAGTAGLVGQRMDPSAAVEAARLGVDVSEHEARRLVEADVREADLVIGMAREHRSAAVQLHPGAMARSFTLIELATILDFLRRGGGVEAPVGDAVPARLASIVAMAAGVRGLVMSETRVELDIVDPYRRDPSVHRRSAEATADAAGASAESLLRLVSSR